MEDTDQIRESREWTERGQGYVNSFRPVRFQPQLALPFILLSGGDNRSAKGGISYVSVGLSLTSDQSKELQSMEESKHSTSPRSSFVAPHREITLIIGSRYIYIILIKMGYPGVLALAIGFFVRAIFTEDTNSVGRTHVLPSSRPAFSGENCIDDYFGNQGEASSSRANPRKQYVDPGNMAEIAF
ncbi:hypothetical protein L484_015552 [Morus notabilis]|uniref:Uncharacterized protein n=1 Tax=Morus notabilis TaxID=981085 RepID=W9SB26_9ROSA|nr:hypothetical protein L484_015552 [Morus notabilis]